MAPEGGVAVPLLLRRCVVAVCGGVARAAVGRDLALRETPLRAGRRRRRQARDAQPQARAISHTGVIPCFNSTTMQYGFVTW